MVQSSTFTASARVVLPPQPDPAGGVSQWHSLPPWSSAHTPVPPAAPHIRVLRCRGDVRVAAILLQFPDRGADQESRGGGGGCGGQRRQERELVQSFVLLFKRRMFGCVNELEGNERNGENACGMIVAKVYHFQLDHYFIQKQCYLEG